MRFGTRDPWLVCSPPWAGWSPRPPEQAGGVVVNGGVTHWVALTVTELPGA
ncbi:MAG: hypothetical protein ACRDR6_31610 [Pseudonocardiaceae bacterium]